MSDREKGQGSSKSTNPEFEDASISDTAINNLNIEDSSDQNSNRKPSNTYTGI